MLICHFSYILIISFPVSDDYEKLNSLLEQECSSIERNNYRNLKFISVNEKDERIEVLYVYSKEYTYTNEDGRGASIWEQHRGCLWIGCKQFYLAVISKHEKMTSFIVEYIGMYLSNLLSQIKMPKKAIDEFTNPYGISRIVLQGKGGEKTTISKPGGITDEQHQEIERLRTEDRIDTSGSYLANITESIKATIKYNTAKGSIGIYKHLPSSVLFDWTKAAINIVFDEIERLKGKSIDEICCNLGISLNYDESDIDIVNGLKWILTVVVNNVNQDGIFEIQVNPCMKHILKTEKYFSKIAAVYCEKCETIEMPICGNCGELLSHSSDGELFCSCKAPISLSCSEGHKNLTDIRYRYFPKPKLKKIIEKLYYKIFNLKLDNFNIFIMDDILYFKVTEKEETESEVELKFKDVNEFIIEGEALGDYDYLVMMKEKCLGTCSYNKIDGCVKKYDMVCLPKIFYGVIPGFRPQPHCGSEYGDISGQISVGSKYYEMKGIIKSNTENKKSISEGIEKPLLSSSKAGQEMIRQFVEQGMNDTRCEVIALVAPQHFDSGFKGSLRFLAKLVNKKTLFIELEELDVVYSKYSKHYSQN